MDKLKKEVRDYLGKHYLCALATVNAENHPLVSVVYYYFDENFNFYFVTRKEMEKYKNLLLNQNVSFVVYDEAGQTSVQLRGVGEAVEVTSKEAPIITNLLEKGHQGNANAFVPLTTLGEGSPIALFKVKVDQVKWLTANPEGKMQMEVYDLKG